MFEGNIVVIMGCFALLTFWPIIGDSGKDQGSFSTYTISPGQYIRKSFSITEPKAISVTVTTNSDQAELSMFLINLANKPLLNKSFTGQFALDFSPSVGTYIVVITNQGSESIEAELDFSYLVLISEKTSSNTQFITTIGTLIIVLGSALATVAIINPRISKEPVALDSNYFPEQVSGNN